MPYNPKNKFIKLCNLGILGFCAATEDGVIQFYRFEPEAKKFSFVAKWSCNALQN